MLRLLMLALGSIVPFEAWADTSACNGALLAATYRNLSPRYWNYRFIDFIDNGTCPYMVGFTGEGVSLMGVTATGNLSAYR
jgi:hypothetical protein